MILCLAPIQRTRVRKACVGRDFVWTTNSK